MKLSRIKLSHFRRFTDCEITDLPDSARLVVLAGPNGCGKSSLFDAISMWNRSHGGFGWQTDDLYYKKPGAADWHVHRSMQIEVHGAKNLERKGAFYLRSAYRNESEFLLQRLERQGPVTDTASVQRMIDSDANTSRNYQRLASQALEDVFDKKNAATTLGDFSEAVTGTVRDAMERIFPGLRLNSLGGPLEQGTFRFDKGASNGIDYKNLSGGEKAAFDLILDLHVNASAFADAVYCIDEPELHLNTALQGRVLEELVKLIPAESQLWISTHSIGMMKQAQEMEKRAPGTVVFIDFGGHDFDQPIVLRPSPPTRSFWERVLRVALDDLADLVAPKEIILCEGTPAGSAGKNVEHDAVAYNNIFGELLPDVKFLSGGNSKDVVSDRVGVVSALSHVAGGITTRRLIDRDDLSDQEVDHFRRLGVSVLGRRNIESYLFDDEVLTALCVSKGKPDVAAALLQEKRDAITASIARGRPPDDVKSASGDIYVAAKRLLALTRVGGDSITFGRDTLARLLVPEMKTFNELKVDIFGS
jgi:predicted ATPase